MKKMLAMVLALVMVLCLTACGESADQPTGGDNTGVEQNQTQPRDPQPTESDVKETTATEDPLLWGATEACSAVNNSKTQVYHINFPKYTGISSRWAMVAEQSADEEVLTAGQYYDSPAVDTLAEVFPTYFTDLQLILKSYYGTRSSNFEFALTDDGKPVTIGDYEMYVFEGTIDFDHTRGHQHYQFVAYATQLKGNGAYAYWVVYDTSDDQSKGDLIAEHAYKMALTFREAD